jgi:hypothetical protein
MYEPKVSETSEVDHGKKTCFAVVSILPTLPVDILIRLDIEIMHPNLTEVYEQFKQIMDNFSEEDAQEKFIK